MKKRHSRKVRKSSRSLPPRQQLLVIAGVALFSLVIFLVQVQTPIEEGESLSGMVVRVRGPTRAPLQLEDLSGKANVRMCNSNRPASLVAGVPVQATNLKSSTFARSTILDERLCSITKSFIGLQNCVLINAVRASTVCNDPQRQGGCYFATVTTRDASKGNIITKKQTFCAYLTPVS